MARELVDDLVNRLSLAGEVPDDSLEEVAALAFRRSVADQIVVVDGARLRARIVEVETTSLRRGPVKRASTVSMKRSSGGSSEHSPTSRPDTVM